MKYFKKRDDDEDSNYGNYTIHELVILVCCILIIFCSIVFSANPDFQKGEKIQDPPLLKVCQMEDKELLVSIDSVKHK